MIVGIYNTHAKKSIWKTQPSSLWKFKQKKTKKIEIRNILIRKKRYEKVVIYFTRYHHGKSLTMLSLYHDELLGKIEDYEGEKKLDDWWFYTR